MRISFNKKLQNRRGIIMFVVLGAILVLGVLVSSYNFFVQGKFNESREILMHLRASKCAQATSSYIFANLLCDLQNISNPSSASELRRVFEENEEDKMSQLMKNNWLKEIKYNEFSKKLLEGLVGKESTSCEVIFKFSDIKFLKELGGEKIPFFPFEKVGRMTVTVIVCIGKTKEVWQETRPFKVVVPFPVPLTKFSFYWNDGIKGDEYGFNTVEIDASDGSAKNRKPFILDNGYSYEENSRDSIWAKRGWIYVGGSGLPLNRANGVKNFGQRYHSYPRSGPPATLLLNFPGGDKFDQPNFQPTNEKLGFRIAHWGFSDSLKEKSGSWYEIFKNEYDWHPYESEKNYWRASSLQLFSNTSVFSSGNDENFIPTITRVTGKVYDRFLKLGYLLPTNSNSSSIFAAVKNYVNQSAFNEAVKTTSSSSNSQGGHYINNIRPSEDDISIDGIGDSDADVKAFLFQPNDNNNPNVTNALNDYFKDITYFDETGNNAVSYHEVMSQIEERDYNVTYDVISGYSHNSTSIHLPPSKSVPEINDDNFSSSFGDGLDVSLINAAVDSTTLKISSIGMVEDTTLGLKYRTCYELSGTSEEIRNSLFNTFGNSSNNGFGLNLNNLVYKVTGSEEEVDLCNAGWSLKSPGAIYSDGPVKISTFSNSNEDDERYPLMILAGKGAVSVDNNDGKEVLAYLVALGDGGTVKAVNPSSKLMIRGGMAVKDLEPDNLPAAGGYVAYNVNLDPTEPGVFGKYFGVAIGPRGGHL